MTLRKQNIEQGYMADGVFHPIRASADYDDTRAGEHTPFTSRRTRVGKAAKKRLGIASAPVQPRLFNPKTNVDKVIARLSRLKFHDSIDKYIAVNEYARKLGVTDAQIAKVLRDRGITGRRTKNPDPVSTFAALAGGMASALAIHDRFAKPKRRMPRMTMKRRGTTTAKRRNPAVKPKTKEKKGRQLYAMTIASGDDLIAVYLKDKKGDGFSKEFRTMAAAKAFATRGKHNVEWNPNPVKIVRKRNVEGFVDAGGVFHPIRASEDYSPALAGERGTSKRRTAKTVRSRFAKTKKVTRKRKTQIKHRAKPAKARKVTSGKGRVTRKQNTRHSAPVTKTNGIISRAIGRYKAKREYAKELRLEAAAERARSRRRKAEAKAKGNPPIIGALYPSLASARAWAKSMSQDGSTISISSEMHAGHIHYRLNSGRLRHPYIAAYRGGKSMLGKRNPPQKHNQRRPAFESFQGRRSDKVYTAVPVSRHAPAKLDQLGDLIEIKIAGGPRLKFNGRGVRLCTARGKLWIAGRRFARPDATQPANVVNPIGEIDHVVYGTFKPHHGDHNYTHYIHKLGEESGKRPILCVDRDGFPVVRGGNYKIEPRGIVD